MLEILYVRAKFDAKTKKHMVLCHQMLSHRNESSSEKGYIENLIRYSWIVFFTQSDEYAQGRGWKCNEQKKHSKI